MDFIKPIINSFLDWRFCLILGGITAAGLFLPLRTVRLARSIGFNVWLFVTIAVASAAGTFIPPETVDVYHSRWFALLLGIMAFDVIACKLRRLPALLDEKPAPDFLAKARHRQSFELNQSPEEILKRAKMWFSSQGLKAKESVQNNGVGLTAGKQRWQRWGDFILHVSIVLILAGNLMGSMFGFEENLPLTEGSAIEMKNRPFRVALNDFDIQYYPATEAPSLYASDLEIKNGDVLIARRRVIVNHPLDIDGVRFYQASWGMMEDFHSATLFVAGREITLLPGEAVPIQGSPFHVRANRFMPTFGLDENGRPANQDNEGRNPALQIDFLTDGKIQGRVWLLRNSPQTAFSIQDGRAVRTAPPPLRLISVDPLVFSGIQVGYDPGAPVFWTGAVCLMIGLCLHFYLHQRRWRVLIASDGGKTKITVGGWSSRSLREFEPEFARWTGGLRSALEGTN